MLQRTTSISLPDWRADLYRIVRRLDVGADQSLAVILSAAVLRAE
jgi:hypothetical protein